LGAQPPESEQKIEQPLTYCILTSGLNSWQTGRLVDRIHTLGTVRLAARRHLNFLSQAGDDLHRLEMDIQRFLAPNIEGIMVSDVAAQQDIANLSTASKKLREIRQSVPGGLPYRVERSRYYRSQFKSLVTALRLNSGGRVEGFQPYDEFVERRFGSAYEFIDMAGKRFDRVEHQLSVFYQRVRIAEAGRLQRRMMQHTRTIEIFQEVAEIGFFVFLVPYYLSTTLTHILLPFLSLFPSFFTKLKPEDPRSVLESGLAIASYVFGWTALFLFRKGRHARRHTQKAKAQKEKDAYITELDLAETHRAGEPEKADYR